MTVAHWLQIVFAIGLILVVIGIQTIPVLILFGLAVMVTPTTIGLMAKIERTK
jgi:hypothetical protein